MSAITQEVVPPGRFIYAFCNVRTNQVLYSLSRTLDNSALKQLPDLGANHTPPVLRKDLWRPLYRVELPPTPDGAKQGLHALQKLREYRKLHELSWEPTSLMTRNLTDKEIAKEKKKLDNRGGSKKETVYDIIKRQKHKMKVNMVMDQKANSIADLAAVLIEQQDLGVAMQTRATERREAQCEETLRLLKEAESGAVEQMSNQVDMLKSTLKQMPKEGDNDQRARLKREILDAKLKLQEINAAVRVANEARELQRMAQEEPEEMERIAQQPEEMERQAQEPEEMERIAQQPEEMERQAQEPEEIEREAQKAEHGGLEKIPNPVDINTISHRIKVLRRERHENIGKQEMLEQKSRDFKARNLSGLSEADILKIRSPFGDEIRTVKERLKGIKTELISLREEKQQAEQRLEGQANPVDINSILRRIDVLEKERQEYIGKLMMLEQRSRVSKARNLSQLSEADILTWAAIPGEKKALGERTSDIKKELGSLREEKEAYKRLQRQANPVHRIKVLRRERHEILGKQEMLQQKSRDFKARNLSGLSEADSLTWTAVLDEMKALNERWSDIKKELGSLREEKEASQRLQRQAKERPAKERPAEERRAEQEQAEERRAEQEQAEQRSAKMRLAAKLAKEVNAISAPEGQGASDELWVTAYKREQLLLSGEETDLTKRTGMPRRGRARREHERPKAPIFAAEGITVKWANIMDAEYAGMWPDAVQHERMGLTTRSFPLVDAETVAEYKALSWKNRRENFQLDEGTAEKVERIRAEMGLQARADKPSKFDEIKELGSGFLPGSKPADVKLADAEVEGGEIEAAQETIEKPAVEDPARLEDIQKEILGNVRKLAVQQSWDKRAELDLRTAMKKYKLAPPTADAAIAQQPTA